MLIVIKLKKTNSKTTLFNIYNSSNILLLENITKESLITGLTLEIEDNSKTITIESIGRCYNKKIFPISSFTIIEYANFKHTICKSAATYKHLTNVKLYNNFYNKIEPYIIEYPFSYKFQDEILQSVQDYSKVFTYLKNQDNLFDNNLKIQIDDKWFNKAVLYNSQQSSGLLLLEQKPKNNMTAQFSFPKYNVNSKTILYTKSDNFYQFNTFWALQKDSQQPLFLNSCESLSIDKIINELNMDYGIKSFKKATLRAKDLKIRYVLDNTSEINIVSQFTTNNTQISYK